MNLPNPSTDAGRLWAETEETLRLLLGRGGRPPAPPTPEAGRGRGALPEEAPPGLRAGKRHERALRALAKEMRRLIAEDRRRGLGV